MQLNSQLNKSQSGYPRPINLFISAINKTPLKILPFSRKYTDKIIGLCGEREKIRVAENEISGSILNSEKFSGFVALDQNGALHGFIGSFPAAKYAYILMRRLPDSPYYATLASILFNSIIPSILRNGHSVIRSNYPIYCPYFSRGLIKSGWKILDEFLIVQNLSHGTVVINDAKVISNDKNQRKKIINFIDKDHVKKIFFNSMLPVGGVWLPLREALSIRAGLKFFIIGTLEKIDSVAILSCGLRSNIIEISGIWGDINKTISAIAHKYSNPLRWYIRPGEKDAAETLGFVSDLKFNNTEEKLYESRYVIVEKELNVIL